MVTTTLQPAQIAEAVERAIGQCASHLRPDVLRSLEAAHAKEREERAQQVLQQLIDNAYFAAEDSTPLCQDTGSVWVYLEVGPDVVVPGDIFSQVDEAVARAYQTHALRMSMLKDALLDRSNTGDNTPAFCEIEFRSIPGATLHVMLKGGGTDNASCVVMLTPGAGKRGIEEAILARVREKASSACPPIIIGVGIGATFDKVPHLAKCALLRSLSQPASNPQLASFEKELLEKVNAMGIGPAGLGGATTALGVHIETAPCHIATLPLAIQMGCSAMRSMSIELIGAKAGDLEEAHG